MRGHSNPGHVTSFDEGGDGFSKMKDFGFHGSIEGSAGSKPHLKSGPREPGRPGPGKGSTNPIQSMEGFSGGGYAEGGESGKHPHGFALHHVDDHHDGTATHHYNHGGYTKFHEDGTVTHHTADGAMAQGGSAHDYAEGGAVNAHPHGHAVTGIESSAEMPDRDIHRHAHGGFTVHYHDGRDPTHHTHDGTPAYHAGGTAGEYAEGGHADEQQDKALISKMMTEHDKTEGESHMARGGKVGMHMPRMSPKAAKPHKPRMPKGPPMDGGALSNAMPINKPPRNPERSVSPRNQMPGGVMPYGVQPSAEPDASQGAAAPGSPGVGAPSMRRGGRAKHYARGGKAKADGGSTSDDDGGADNQPMTPDAYRKSRGLPNIKSNERFSDVQRRIMGQSGMSGSNASSQPAQDDDTPKTKPLDSFSAINKALTK